MRLHLSCCFFIVFYFAAIPLITAQHLLQGRVSDKEGKPVVSAVVLLQSLPDSSILKTGLTDSNGNYKLQTDANDKGLIKIIATSYLVAYKKANAADEVIDITLESDSKLLKDVLVSARKPLIERQPDRIVFNVESSIAAIGNDAMSILKKAPGVRVHDDEISLAGKSTVNVMINDKLIQLSGDELIELLSSMPAENILKIEVITAPPAKYDASGNSGIINIVTKRSISDGFKGNVTTGYSIRSLGSPFMSGNVNYKKGKLNAYCNISSAYFRSIPTAAYTVYYPQQRWEQHNTQQNLYPYVRVQAGADYTIGKKSTVGFLYTLGASSPVYKDDTKTKMLNQGTNLLDSTQQTNARETGTGVRNVLNLNYEYRIDSSGKKLNVDFDYFTRNGQRKRDFTSYDIFPDGSTGAQSMNRTNGTQIVNIRSVKTDLTLPVKWARFTLGAKASFINNTSDNQFADYNGSTYVNDLSRSNKFDYTENTQAVYASAEKNIGKFGIQAGLRAENTQAKGYSPTLSITNRYNYFKLFPSLFFQYNINDDNNLNLNFTRRIQRPDFMLLNPFRYYSNLTSYETGNPFLQPSYSNNIELGYTFKSKYTLTFFVQRVTDLFAQVMNVDTAGDGFNFTNDNVGTELNYGLTLNAAVQPADWMESNLEFYGYYTYFNSSYYQAAIDQSYTRPSFNISVNNTFFLNSAKTLSAELNLDYEAKQLSQFNLQYQTFNMEAGVKALFFKKKLTLAFDAEDIFATDRYKLKNLYNGSLTNSYGDERTFRFSLSYKFGSLFDPKRRESTSGIEERKALNNKSGDNK